MILGFTGTRKGLTAPQRESLRAWLASHAADVTDAHHGAAIGADEQFVEDVLAFCPDATLFGSPCHIDSQRSEAACDASDYVYPLAPPLERNRFIVDACHLLLACPGGMAEEQRSGTWATIRYARKDGKRVVIFWPDGRVEG